MAEQSIYNFESKDTDKKITLPEESKDRIRLFPQSEDDNETLSFLSKRIKEMDDSRDDADWNIRMDQFESNIFWNEDGTAETNLPIEKVTIRNKMADELSQKPVVTFLPTEKSDIDKVEQTKEIWDFVWNESETDKEMFKQKLCKNIFGTAFWFEGMHKEYRTELIPEILKDGRVTGTAKQTEMSWLRGWNLDIRDVFIDPVSSIEEAVDCFILERNVSPEALEQLKNDPNYIPEGIDMALEAGTNNYTEDVVHTFRTDTEASIDQSTLNKYTLRHYYNKEKGIYAVTVGAGILIREGATPYAHGELPISVEVDHPKYNSIYGEGECELLESTKYERNEIRNQILDTVRRANDQKLLLGSDIALQNDGYIDDTTQVLSYDGDISQFQQIKGGIGVDSGLFNVEERLMQDATMITGIDINSLSGVQTKTAFEARLQEQTKLKGIAVGQKLTDFFLTRMARQRLANIQFWLPTTTGKRLTEPNKVRSIPIKDKSMKVNKRFDSKKQEVVEAGVTFSKSPGETSFLELKPAEIRNSLDVVVMTPSTTSVLRELDKLDLQEVFKNVLEAAQLDPAIAEKFDVNKYLDKRLEQIGESSEDFFTGDDKTKEIQDTRASVLEEMPLPPKASGQPERQELNPITQNPELAQVTGQQ